MVKGRRCILGARIILIDTVHMRSGRQICKLGLVAGQALPACVEKY